ncbi:MAG: PAS domain-containing protein [Deltaproteobacteria bacterium]|nr:PAS domain-containing protein [Deltaproteobacteria bacterium]
MVHDDIRDSSEGQEYGLSRLNWLILARIGIVTFLLGLATFIEVMGMESLSAVSAPILYKIIILTYFLSILYVFLKDILKNLPLNVYVQGIGDLALVTAMIYATGGIHSIYSVFYPLVIIYSVLFLDRKGGFIIASIAGVFYGISAGLELYGILVPIFPIVIYENPVTAGFAITRTLTHVLSFYLIAYLASFLVAQEKKTRTLLAEKQNAFEQLDLLHQSIIESVDSGILTIDLNGKIKTMNRAAAEITGFTLPEVANRDYASIFGGFPSINVDKSNGQNGNGAKTRFEMAFRTRDHRSLVLACSVSPLRDHRARRIGSIVIFHDMTEINEMKESLEKSRRLAFIGEMAAGLAHEIRNPLASIGGSIQLLQRDTPQSQTRERLMQIILRGKDQLENFMRDFLMMARPVPGAMESFDIREVIQDVVESLRCTEDWPEALETDILPGTAPLNLDANKGEIRQVLWNVVLNAVQSMPQGGTLRVEAKPLRLESRDGVEVRVEDTGCGIASNDLERVFEPFYTKRGKGTGLGLAVVNRIVEGYGGRILMNSQSGKGTTCKVWFPGRGPDSVESANAWK